MHTASDLGVHGVMAAGTQCADAGENGHEEEMLEYRVQSVHLLHEAEPGSGAYVPAGHSLHEDE